MQSLDEKERNDMEGGGGGGTTERQDVLTDSNRFAFEADQFIMS